MRVRAADVTPGVMEQLFKSHGPLTSDLPADARIIDIQRSVDWERPPVWRVWFTSNEFDDVPENMMPPIDLTITMSETNV